MGKKGCRVIIGRDIVFNESCMLFLEGKKGNLTENDVQIEVEPVNLDNTSSEVGLNETNTELAKSKQYDNTVSSPEEY